MPPARDCSPPPADPVAAAYQVVRQATRDRDNAGRQRVIFDVTGPPAPAPDVPPSEDDPQ